MNKSYYVSLFVSLIIQIINRHYLVQNKSYIISEDDGELLRTRPRTMCAVNSVRIWTEQYSVYSEPARRGGQPAVSNGHAAWKVDQGR